jgi:putative spermidine/putrescine transport system substrate-binding protein
MRRNIIIKCCAISIIAIALFISCNQTKSKKENQDNSLVVLSFGGQFADAQREAYFKPFDSLFNIPIKEAEYGGEFGKLLATINSGNISFDVIDVESVAMMRGISNNIFEKLDYSIIDTSGIIKAAINPYAIGTDFYSVSLGFNSKVFPTDKLQPKTWSDFWDVNRFPGGRCLKDDPKFSLEIALLADGVAIDKIYANDTFDIDRAFKKLDEIKPYIKLWWSTGMQPIQAISNGGDVVLGAAYGARLWIAKNNNNEPIEFTWNQSITDIEYWAILKGAKQYELSNKFIAFAVRPKNQAKFSTIFPLGPANKNAFLHLDSITSKTLNTYNENFKNQLILNAKWWAEHEADVLNRWNQWKTKK